MHIPSLKRHVAILFGGTSVEHQVSIASARNVMAAIDTTAFKITLIGIDPSGKWQLCQPSQLLEGDPWHNAAPLPKKLEIRASRDHTPPYDVVFPVLHGTGGEDGSMQGLLALAGIPVVGCGTLSSAIAMDKAIAKQLWRTISLPMAESIVLKAHQRHDINFTELSDRLGLPFFVKPANCGSSVGVAKVHNAPEFAAALDLAFTYDTKILIEEYIAGQEVECAVLGNDHPKVSAPGSIAASAEFYSYAAKYNKDAGSTLVIPAAISDSTAKELQRLAIAAFQSLDCAGMARVDFFVTKDEQIFLNEINTIPGFTSTSMYPKLWEYSGVSYTELLTTLITLALERDAVQRQLHHSLAASSLE